MSNHKMVEGRVCIVTGAGRGIGREYALMLGAHGGLVVVNDLGASRDGSGGDSGPAQDVANEIKAAGGQAVANTDDISSYAGAKSIVDQAIDTFGGLDVVVNNAGILRDRMLFSMAEEEWDSVIKVHLKGTFGTSRFAAEYWRNRSKDGKTNDARIINTSSVAGLYANPGQANYAAAKAGLQGFSRALAMEIGSRSITVNCVAPGFIETDMTRELGAEQTQALLAKIPLGRYGQPEEIAAVVGFLASMEAGYITGETIHANGGMYMG